MKRLLTRTLAPTCSAASSTGLLVSVAVPQQTHTLAEMAGDWNMIGSDTNDAGTTDNLVLTRTSPMAGALHNGTYYIGVYAVPGTRLDVLAHTPLAQARLSGRVADVVQAYGDQIVGRLEISNVLVIRSVAPECM